MLHRVRLENYRGFREFEMSGLARVNLLVGTNNCGKTSLLEALHILADPGSPGPVWGSLVRRGETRLDAEEDREFEVAHLVHEHALEPGRSFAIVGSEKSRDRRATATFREYDPDRDGPKLMPVVRRGRPRQLALIERPDSGDTTVVPLLLELVWTGGEEQELLWPISRRGGVSVDDVYPRRGFSGDRSRVALITTEGLSRRDVVAWFDATVLTPEEETVLDALRKVEPTIHRIASVGSEHDRYYVGSRGGMAVLLGDRRVPIGSMGDGVWRLLGLALALVRSAGGTLLVDEIDTGLHYSVLVDMWRLVLETARRLDVQVFATTHSRDCYEALAAVVGSGHEVSLQRIERGRRESIAFNDAELAQAASRGIEVR